MREDLPSVTTTPPVAGLLACRLNALRRVRIWFLGAVFYSEGVVMFSVMCFLFLVLKYLDEVAGAVTLETLCKCLFCFGWRDVHMLRLKVAETERSDLDVMCMCMC